jgi:hypothetical protein
VACLAATGLHQTDRIGGVHYISEFKPLPFSQNQDYSLTPLMQHHQHSILISIDGFKVVLALDHGSIG